MERPYGVLVVTMWFINLKSAVKWQFIGFEIRANYCEIAANRIDNLLREKQVDAEILHFLNKKPGLLP